MSATVRRAVTNLSEAYRLRFSGLRVLGALAVTVSLVGVGIEQASAQSAVSVQSPVYTADRVNAAATGITSGLTDGFAGTQVIRVRDGQPFSAPLSVSAPTRLHFKHDGAKSLIFNQVEGVPPEVSAEVDDRGDVYVAVVLGQPGQKLTGFLTTQGGRTYPVSLDLVLGGSRQVEVVSVEAEEAIVRDKREAAKAGSPTKTVKWRKTASHREVVATLLRHGFYGHVPEGFAIQKTSSRADLPDFGADARLSVRSEHSVASADYRLQRISVRNVGETYLRDADLIGALGTYVGATVLGEGVAPGESVRMVVLRRRAG